MHDATARGRGSATEQLSPLKRAIARLEREIDETSNEIKGNDRKLAVVATNLLNFRDAWTQDTMLQSLHDSATDYRDRLYDEQRYLRDENKSLRDREKSLRDNEKLLMEQLSKQDDTRSGQQFVEEPEMYVIFRDLVIPNPLGIMKLKGNTLWLCGALGGEPLFVRPCYAQLYEEMMARYIAERDTTRPSGLILLGNPGIGKSCLLNYFLVRLLQNDKSVYVHLEKGQRGYLFQNGTCACFESATLPRVVANDPKIFQLFDPMTRGKGPDFKLPFCVIAASPRKDHWIELSKDIQPVQEGALSSMLYIPQWSKEEVLEHVRLSPKGKVLKLADVDATYDVCGGIPRQLYRHTAEYLKSELLQTVQNIDLAAVIPPMIANNAPVAQENPHVVFQIAVERLKDRDGYDFSKKTIGYVSRLAKDLVLERLMGMKQYERNELYYSRHLQGKEAAGHRGLVFEAICHDQVPKRLARGIAIQSREGTIFPKSKGHPRAQWPSEVLPFTPKKKGIPRTMFWEILKEGVYYRASTSFPAIDALFKLNNVYYAFQYTIASKHTVHIEGLASILRSPDVCARQGLHLVFVHDSGVSEYKPGRRTHKEDENDRVLVKNHISMWEYAFPVRTAEEKITLKPVTLEEGWL